MDYGARIATVFAVCVLAASGAAVIFIVAGGSFGNEDSYSITYELDGGTLPDGAPTYYTAKNRPDLPIPEKEGVIFMGWRESADAEDVLKTIPESYRKDLTLYATWEISQVGTRITFDHYSNFNIYGYGSTPATVTFDYLCYTYPDGYLMCMTRGDYTNTYWTSENEDTEWTEGDEMTVQTKNFGDRVCIPETSTDTNGKEIQYIGKDDGEVYRIETYAKSGLFGKYTLTDCFELKSVTQMDFAGYFDVCAYADAGITINDCSGLNPGEYFTVTATVSSGYKFGGWYDENDKLLSAEPSYTFRVESDIYLYAMNETEYDYTDHISTYSKSVPLHTGKTLTNVSWSIYSRTSDEAETRGVFHGTGTSVSNSKLNVGVYDVYYSGKDSGGRMVYGTYTQIVDGHYTFSWTYNYSNYVLETEISGQDYLKWKSMSTTRSSTRDSDHILEFVTYTDPVIVNIANRFNSMTYYMSEAQKANVVLSYVQNIPYQYDSDFNGEDEYWKYAVETVFDGAGDCEDTSILFCAITKAMGIKTAISTLRVSDDSAYISKFATGANHCMGLVSVTGITPESDAIVEVKNDGTYYLCETTATGYNVGVNPWLSSRVITTVVV